MDLPDIGEPVTVTSGPFSSMKGVVTEQLSDRALVKVEITIFGRVTVIELGEAALSWASPLVPEWLGAQLDALGSDDHSMRSRAALALGARGLRASAATGELIYLLQNDRCVDVRIQAARALGKIDPLTAEPALGAALSDRSARVVQAALGAIRMLGEDASDVIQQSVLRALGSSRDRVRWEAAGTIAALRCRAPADIDVLISAIEAEPSRKIRGRIAYALARIGPEALPAAGALVRIIDRGVALDEPYSFDKTLFFALKKIGARPQLVTLLEQHADGAIHAEVLRVLA